MDKILGSAGILEPDLGRDGPNRGDWHFVGDWRGVDQYNSAAVRKYFGSYGFQ